MDSGKSSDLAAAADRRARMARKTFPPRIFGTGNRTLAPMRTLCILLTQFVPGHTQVNRNFLSLDDGTVAENYQIGSGIISLSGRGEEKSGPNGCSNNATPLAKDRRTTQGLTTIDHGAGQIPARLGIRKSSADGSDAHGLEDPDTSVHPFGGEDSQYAPR